MALQVLSWSKASLRNRSRTRSSDCRFPVPGFPYTVLGWHCLVQIHHSTLPFIPTSARPSAPPGQIVPHPALGSPLGDGCLRSPKPKTPCSHWFGRSSCRDGRPGARRSSQRCAALPRRWGQTLEIRDFGVAGVVSSASSHGETEIQS